MRETLRHAQPAPDVLRELRVEPGVGLSADSVADRRERYGPNRIRRSKGRSVFAIWAAQFRTMVVAILTAAAVLAFAFGKHTEGVAILAVVLVNSLIGFVSEWRAARSMEALRRMGKRRVRVRRAGTEREVESAKLVPGDICLHEGGDMVSADLRLIEANSLQVDESVLTGESVPVPKRVDPVEAGAPLADRTCMLYRGTLITEGSATGVVTATGMETELGRIAELAEEAQGAEDTPLERNLSRLGHRLAWVALGAGALIGAAGWIVGKPTVIMIETAIALGVAAVPEGLPFVATIALARGMWLMARKQALINRLPAVETLGTTNVIFTDKTGTLTENRMVGAKLCTSAGDYDLRDGAGDGEGDGLFRRALEIGALCNNASLSGIDEDGEIGEAQGDPTEIALLAAAARSGLDRDDLLARASEVREVAFDPEVMMMATVHQRDGRCYYAVKGAPQSVLEVCAEIAGESPGPGVPEAKRRWLERAAELAGEGLRVLALADKTSSSPDDPPYQGLRLVGLIGLYDPPRDDVKRILADCREAGIRVVMVTGDQPDTARAIAAAVGLVDDADAPVMTGGELGDLDAVTGAERRRLLETRVFARIYPEQKLRLLKLFQQEGNIVAMTGDGVNDAPALNQADIGVAMGRRGTDAAKESADMVLKNDALSSILAAVEQGRIIFSNIRKSVMFMLCTNVAEVAAVGLASLLDWPLPLRPLQILFLNVITDVFPALALSVGAGDAERAMRQPPRDADEAVLGRSQWTVIAAYSGIISICVLAALMIGVNLLGVPTPEAVTLSFLTLAFAKLWFVLNLREPRTTVLRNDVTGNRWMWLALALCAALLLAAVYAPGLSDVLETAAPAATGWLVILVLSALPVLAGQAALAVRTRS